MSDRPTPPKWMLFAEVIRDFFGVTSETFSYPLTCTCGFVAQYAAGVAIHVKKEHNIFVIRDRDKDREKTKKILASREGVKA